jgi:hypothetical protein
VTRSVEASGLVCTTCMQVSQPGGRCGCPVRSHTTSAAQQRIYDWHRALDQRDLFRRVAEGLTQARPLIGIQQNNVEATAARRQLLELCVAIADEYGHEVRHGGR